MKEVKRCICFATKKTSRGCQSPYASKALGSKDISGIETVMVKLKCRDWKEERNEILITVFPTKF